MSANRIVRRRAFRSSPKAADFHDHEIAIGDRHWSFQKNIRNERREHGLSFTSSNMSRVHGKRVA